MIKKRPMSAHGTDVERRKSRRFPVFVPVEVSWRGPDGTALKEDAVARQVNANGGFLKTSSYPALGTRITLANFPSARTAEARVLAAPDSRPGVAKGIVIELIVPNEDFWGVELQVNKTLIELQNLEKALRGEEIDPQLAQEYRYAIDYICNTTDTLRRLRTSKPHPSDDPELLSLLGADRIRRATTDCLEVIAALDSGHVEECKDVEDLVRAIQQLQQRLK
jgi:hypothetical protein